MLESQARVRSIGVATDLQLRAVQESECRRGQPDTLRIAINTNFGWAYPAGFREKQREHRIPRKEQLHTHKGYANFKYVERKPFRERGFLDSTRDRPTRIRQLLGQQFE